MTDTFNNQYRAAETNYAALAAEKLKRDAEAARKAALAAASAIEVDKYLQTRIATSLLTGNPDSKAIELAISRSTDQPKRFLEYAFDLLVHPVSGLARQGKDWILGSATFTDIDEMRGAIEGYLGTSFAADTAWFTALLPHVLFPDPDTSEDIRKAIAVAEAYGATSLPPANLTPEDRALLYRTFEIGDVFEQNIEL